MQCEQKIIRLIGLKCIARMSHGIEWNGIESNQMDAFLPYLLSYYYYYHPSLLLLWEKVIIISDFFKLWLRSKCMYMVEAFMVDDSIVLVVVGLNCAGKDDRWCGFGLTSKSSLILLLCYAILALSYTCMAYSFGKISNCDVMGMVYVEYSYEFPQWNCNVVLW